VNPDQMARDMEESEHRMAELVRLGDTVLARSYAPGKWNAYRILAHVADSQLVFYYRFLNAIAESEKPIVPFDQDRWMAAVANDRRPAEISIAQLRGIHSAWGHQLRTQAAEALQSKTIHPERGEMTPLDIAEYGRRHLLHPWSQLEAIRDGQTWTPRPWPWTGIR
jgi:hypothetical protein